MNFNARDHDGPKGVCTGCLANRASLRLYGTNAHRNAIGDGQIEKQRRIEAALRAPLEAFFPPPLVTVYPPRGAAPLTHADIERRFTYHRPEGRKVMGHEDVRALFKALAQDLNAQLTAGREASLAFTALEEASFWAHAAIARDGK